MAIGFSNYVWLGMAALWSADKPVKSLSGEMISGRIMRLRYHDKGFRFLSCNDSDEDEKDVWRTTQQQ